MAIDPQKLHEFVGKAVNDLGAMLNGALVAIGDKLGLYKAIAAAGPLTPAELAERTGTTERYVREWLNAQAASGFVEYDPKTMRYSLSPEQAEALTNEDSPFCVLGGFQGMTSVVRTAPKVMQAFRTGEGVAWHEHEPDLFLGTERFFRPGYNANLVSSWIPALEGVEEKLRRGARVADVGCGHGASTIIMARAFPKAEFVGFDFHPPSIAAATERAQAAGLGDRVRFEVSSAGEFPGKYDFVTFFDCLHDMGDPVAVARHVLEAIRPDGTWMLVEPFAGDRVEQNLNPIGRVFYAASTLVCCPASMAQEGRAALGAQAGEARMREVMRKAGFGSFRRATETPFNLVYDIRA